MAGKRGSLAVDRATFGSLTEPFRHDLLLHCYRLVGSVHDAEDLVQETLARAWRGRAEYRGEAGLRTWLRQIATRVCLDSLRRDRRRRALPGAMAPDQRGEVVWLEPLPDDLLRDAEADPAAVYELRESVSLAFLTALQQLPPRQRAVLILRDVLALRASEAASVLEISVPGINSLLHRARRTMRTRYRPPTGPAEPDAKLTELLRRYVAAWEAGDLDALLRVLKADALLEMPPIPSAPVGRRAIGSFLAGSILDGTAGRWRAMTTAANGGPALALYERDADGYRFTGLQLIGVDGGLVARVTAYMDAGLAARFRLPARLPT